MPKLWRMLKPGGSILILYMAWLPFEDEIAEASEKLVWNGRIKACRGIGASLTEEEISRWEEEHKKLLAQIAPDEFTILHYGAIAELRKK